MLAAGSIFAYVVWQAARSPYAEAPSGQVPLIRADQSKTRIRPAEPGGMEVPYQDKTIYERMAAGETQPAVEMLMARPEEPLVRPRRRPSLPPRPPAPAPERPAARVLVPTTPPAEPPVAAAEPVSVTPPAPAEPVAAPAFRVQLASFRERAAADQGWRQFKAKAPALLDVLAPRVVAVDLGDDRGTYFRLQAGPLDSREAADALCAALEARKLDCLVVAP